MTTHKTLKRHVRERMATTGERYAAARDQVVRKRERVRAATQRFASSDGRPSDDAVVAATGRGWDAWFGHLDAWGGQERTHAATALHLTKDLAVPGWWAQSITIYYQRARGLRLMHQQADGFTVSASRTIAAPVGAVFEAFVDPDRRATWLRDGSLSTRSSRRDHPVARTARFDWDGGPTRLLVTFEDKGPTRTTVSVAHERLPDPAEAEAAKVAWRGRLGTLKAMRET